jgi:V8-like Glu-specific endopeptidase
VFPFAIKGGNDNRVVYGDSSYPWGCVCLVRSGARMGSGVLVGPRHVLTASHVIDWRIRSATVEVFRYDTAWLASSCCAKATTFTEIDDIKHFTVDEDYAVLTTVARVGDDFGWMGTRTYDAKWDDEPLWMTIGYPGDLGGGARPAFERDFHLDEDELDLGEARSMDCGADIMLGQSGGPVFAFWPDGVPYVVAVISAGDNGDNYCAGGSWLPKLVREARDADP